MFALILWLIKMTLAVFIGMVCYYTVLGFGIFMWQLSTGQFNEDYVDPTPVDNTKYMPVELRNAIKPD